MPEYMKTLFLIRGDFDIAVFVFNLQGILCLIFRTDELIVIFISHDISEFFRDIDFTCFCLYRKCGKSFFGNAECNITKVTCKLIFSTERNIFCFYVSIHHLNLTISKYSIIDFQITKVGTEFKIFEVAV